MVRILICDDHSVVRRGLKQILEENPGFRVEGEAGCAADMLRLLRQRPFDILILDLTMPGKNGLEALKEVKCEWPRLPVLVLSVHAENQYAIRTLKAGAAGYMTKETAPEELLRAVSRILAGASYISPSLAENLVERIQAPEPASLHEKLSDREYQIFCLLAAGESPTRISQQLHLSIKTVSTYRTRILEKMRMQNNAQLTHYAILHRLIDCLSESSDKTAADCPTEK